MKTISINELSFEINYSDKRKSMDIIVDRNAKLFINVPKHTKIKPIREFVKEKEFWIYRKLDQKDALLKRSLHKTEKLHSLFYMGKKYPVIFKNNKQNSNSVLLKNGKFILNSKTKKDLMPHIVNWYSLHAKTIILHRLEKFQNVTGLVPTKIRVMDLGNRWGSCSSNNILNFHWKVILSPSKIIDYVILHEMIHMLEKSHNSEFWKKLGKFMPDYRSRKQWLAQNGFELQI